MPPNSRNDGVLGGSDTNQHSLKSREAGLYESFLNIHQRQTIIFIVTHLLAFDIGFAFKLHPQHGDFPQLKATWIPASRHLGDVLLLEIDEAR